MLACYPKAFRQENTEEILAVLLASAAEGQRRAQHGATYAGADMIAGAALWLLALATMAFIFTRKSNTCYRLGARRPTAHATG